MKADLAAHERLLQAEREHNAALESLEAQRREHALRINLIAGEVGLALGLSGEDLLAAFRAEMGE